MWKKVLIVSGLILLSLKCKYQKEIIDRTFYAYLPLKTGNFWKFVNTRGDTFLIKIVSDSTLDDDTIFKIFWLDSLENFLYKPLTGKLLIHHKKIVWQNGEPYTLEDVYLDFLELPPVLGNSWESRYQNRIYISENIYRIVETLQGEVDKNFEIMRINGQVFENVYRLSIYQSYHYYGEDTVLCSDTTRLYLAAGVGPVKIIKKTDYLKDTLLIVSHGDSHS